MLLGSKSSRTNPDARTRTVGEHGWSSLETDDKGPLLKPHDGGLYYTDVSSKAYSTQKLVGSFDHVAGEYFDKALSVMAESKAIKIKEPGWYVVDHMDKPVDGPMQERGAKELADEMNEKHAAKHGKGDIDPYSAEYYSDYEIRRMNESQMIDDADVDGDENEFVGISSSGKKLIVKRDGKQLERPASIFGAKIVESKGLSAHEALMGFGVGDKPRT